MMLRVQDTHLTYNGGLTALWKTISSEIHARNTTHGFSHLSTLHKKWGEGKGASVVFVDAAAALVAGLFPLFSFGLLLLLFFLPGLLLILPTRLLTLLVLLFVFVAELH